MNLAFPGRRQPASPSRASNPRSRPRRVLAATVLAATVALDPLAASAATLSVDYLSLPWPGYFSASTSITDPTGASYTVGGTADAIPGATNAGDQDAWIVKRAPDGAILWSQQLGTTMFDGAGSIAVGPDGDAYIAGYTGGAFPGYTNAAHNNQGFVAKLDAGTGQVRWIRQIQGTGIVVGRAVAVTPDGTAILVGENNDEATGVQGNGRIIVAAIAADGSPRWTTYFGTQTPVDMGWIAAATDGSVVVVGSSLASGFPPYGDLPGTTPIGTWDGIAARVSAAGQVEWEAQFGTSGGDFPTRAVITPDGGVTIASRSTGYTPGFNESVLTHLDATGGQRWVRVLGIPDEDAPFGLTPRDVGGVYVVGYALGPYADNAHTTNATDAYLAEIAEDGAVESVAQVTVCSNRTVGLMAMTTDVAGNAYVVPPASACDAPIPTAGFIGGPGAAVAATNVSGLVAQVRNPAASDHPGAPTHLTADVSGTELTLAWLPPALTGSSPIAAYDVSLMPTSGDRMLRTCTGSPCTLGVPAGFRGVAFVSARNEDGHAGFAAGPARPRAWPTLTYTGATSATALSPVSLSGKLTTSTGAALAGRTLSFSLCGQSIGDASTNSKGVATISALAPASGPCDADVRFGGDSSYGGKTAQGAISIARIATALTYSGKTSVTRPGTFVATATLKTTKRIAVTGGGVSFTWAGTTYGPVQTDASGIASYTLPIPAGAGKYTLTIAFGGGGAYAGSSAAVAVTVR